MIRSSSVLLLFSAVTLPILLVSAKPQFQARIPNGANVMYEGVSWPAVGHGNPSGSPSSLNPFGADFEAAGLQWTVALCQKDSDGDGVTNGEELGDPNCIWQVGQAPTRTTGITHPGFADAASSSSSTSSSTNAPGTGSGGSTTTSTGGGTSTTTTTTGESDDEEDGDGDGDGEYDSDGDSDSHDYGNNNGGSTTASSTSSTTATTTNQLAEEPLRLPKMLVVHIVCMTLSWGFFLPIGALMACSCKGLLKNGRWFVLHVSIQMLGLLLSIVGFFVIFVYVGAPHFEGTHPLVGLVVFVSGLVQALGGFIRPHKPHKGEQPTLTRTVWEYCHKGFGRIVIVLAWINSFMGIRLVKSDYTGLSSNLTRGIFRGMNILLGIQVGLCLVLTFVAIFVQTNDECDCEDSSTEMKKTTRQSDEDLEEQS